MKYKTDRADPNSAIQQRNNHKIEHHEQEIWRNSLISLHKVLNNLQNENLRRYNQELSQFSMQNPSQINYKTQKITNKKREINNHQSAFKFTIQPEPWYNDNEFTRLKKQRNIANSSKSFHLTLPKNLQTHKLITRHNRSSSTIDPSNLNTLRDGEFERLKKLKQTISEKDKFITQNFNYTNEQKAKVSIIHLAHEKQHKKIQKILKYKAHFIDKTGLKQQKINQHSKYLIQALKNLSFDELIPHKKKSSLKIQGNKRVNTQVKQQSHQMKSYSCGKLRTLDQTNLKLNFIPDQVKYSIKRLEPQIIKIDQPPKDKQQYKVSFKPRRKWIFDKKSASQKNLMENCQNQTLKLKYIQRVQKVSSHFLKINKLGK